MHELIHQIVSELRNALRFRWWGATTAWLAGLAGILLVASMPNVYEASARVYVDTSSVLRPILNNQIVPVNIETQLNYVRQALLGREYLARVANETNLDAAAMTPIDRENVLNNLRARIQIQTSTSGSGDNIYRISYRHANRETAVGVVSALLNALVEDTIGANAAGAATAERFLDERIAEYEARLQQAETALAEFKKRHADRLPGTQGGYFERMRAETEALEDVRKELRLARSRRERLLEQLHSESPVMPAMGLESRLPPDSIDARIRDQRLRLDQLLLQYTERHPDVIAARETLARLEEQRASQLRALGVTDGGVELSSLGSNPVYQSVQMAVNEVDVEIAALEVDVAERAAKVEELQSLIDEVPEVEAELARLNRDYDVVYQQYQALVRSRETQELSQKAAAAEQVDFRIIDPPLASFDPVAPNRLRLLVVVFLGALGVGGGLSWLLAQFRPVFENVQDLREVCGLPVIGSVTQVWSRSERIRKQMATACFVASIGGLFALFVGAVLIERVGPGLRVLLGGVGMTS